MCRSRVGPCRAEGDPRTGLLMFFGLGTSLHSLKIIEDHEEPIYVGSIYQRLPY